MSERGVTLKSTKYTKKVSMSNHEKINYIEFPAKDMEATKAFFEQVFGWTATDYGPDYSSFQGGGLEVGVFRSDLCSSTENGATLMVFYSEALEQTQEKIERACGNIVKPIFSFPGGRRFQFTDPNGNEFAVWSDQGL